MTKPPTSCPTFERSAELGDVVVIVRRKPADPVGKSEATPAEVDASALPLRRREGSQERQHLRPAPLKCGQSFPGVVADVLALRGPSLGIQRVANRAPDPPRSQILRARPEHEDPRLVERHDSMEPDLEELLDNAQVADDYLR